MAVLQLPEYIYNGLDSVGGIFEADYKKILVVADSDVPFSSGILDAISKKAHKHGVSAEFLIQENPDDLTEKIQEALMDSVPDVLIAVGGGRTIDCIAVVSALSEIPYYAIPRCAPTALWSEDEVEVIMNRKVPDGYIFDPDIIIGTNSLQIAYEGLGMLTLCAEGCLKAENRYISALAKAAFVQIVTNILPAYQGEISARENLLEAMGWAQISYVNSHSFSWESPCYRLCEFFKVFETDSLSVLAASSVQLIKRIFSDNESILNEITLEAFVKNKSKLNQDYLFERIRMLRAKMLVPSCVKNLNVDEEAFTKKLNELSDEDKYLFTECFYTSFFEENENTVLAKY